MSERLYLRCAGCSGTRKTVTDFNTDRTVSAAHCGKCAGMKRYSVPGMEPGSSWTFAPCPVCADAKGPSDPVPLVIPAGSKCTLCADGYAPAGITQAQVERIQNEGERLLEFIARFADSVPSEFAAYDAFIREALSILDGKRGRVEEYRRKHPSIAEKRSKPA